MPNDPDSYYKSRELVPCDMLDDLNKAKIVITNYHAFKLRERMALSKGGRLLLQGRQGAPLETLETEGQMLQRVMPELMGLKNILIINDEAHHCYGEKPGGDGEETLKGMDFVHAGCHCRHGPADADKDFPYPRCDEFGPGTGPYEGPQDLFQGGLCASNRLRPHSTGTDGSQFY
jgi:hypothetical protein